MAASPAAAAVADVDLAALSLEELLEVEVFSAARHEQPLFETPAAVEVVSGEQIRRAGVLRLPEALRLTTGVHVKHIDASKWSVTMRGFANRFANKLLVLLDGRTVYSPLFAGVLWESQDLVLQDVAQIEAVRGPGGTLWGTNAVNGVINIITLPADQTQGTLLQVAGGPEERGHVVARHGGRLGPSTWYRIYAKAQRRDALRYQSGADASDTWAQGRVGFRLDAERRGSRWTASGEAYRGEMGQTMEEGYSLTPPYLTRFDYDTDLAGSHLLLRQVRGEGADGELRIAASHDFTSMRDTVFSGAWHTVGLDLQQLQSIDHWHALTWGGGVRTMWDHLRDTSRFSIRPRSRRTWVASAFAQGEARLPDPRGRVTLGTKLEHNDYTGVEVLPSARLIFTDGERWALWTALSRTVRLPTRAEADGSHLNAVEPLADQPGSPLFVTRLEGNAAIDAEVLRALEAGARWRPARSLTLDGAGFYNRYDEHFSGEPMPLLVDTLATPPRITLRLTPGNLVSGYTAGAEVNAEWHPGGRCRLSAGYAYLYMDLDLEPGSRDPGTLEFMGDNPRHRARGRASVDLPRRTELDVMLQYLGRLPLGWNDRVLSMDVRLATPLAAGLEVALVAQSLTWGDRDGLDPELMDTVSTRSQRSVYLSLRYLR
ncbi:MAG: TonB-dependent receptor [Candidatus Latescibacterota bacterium]